MLKLTTDKHEASRGLSATAELLVTKLREIVRKLCATLKKIKNCALAEGSKLPKDCASQLRNFLGEVYVVNSAS